MPPAKDITGQKFSRLTALLPTNKRSSNGGIVWQCRCDCGNLTETTVDTLTSGNTQSCGCLVKEVSARTGHANALDISGEKFGRLLALYPVKSNKQQSIVWKCICNCGNYTTVSVGNLRSGAVCSCGCAKAESARSRCGDKHPNWKGGTRTKNKIIRMSSQYKKWRHLVFERDHFTCQNCGQCGDYIVAHHLKDFSTYSELRFCVANGVTLCLKCHIKFHKKYGYSCDISDFQEFIEEESNDYCSD